MNPTGNTIENAINATRNTIGILQLESALADLQMASAAPLNYSLDQTPMPDGNGTVQTRFSAAIDKLEICWIVLLADFKTESQQAAFASEVNAALTPAALETAPAPAPATAAPAPIADSIQPKPHRPRQNPLSGHWE